MDMFKSMTMPYVFYVGLAVLAILVIGLYVTARVVAGRREQRERSSGPTPPPAPSPPPPS